MLNPDYRDILVELSDAGAEFLVVGVYAVAAHGNPRATGDLDIWVRPSAENAEPVLRALTGFGVPVYQLNEHDLTMPGLVFQIGAVPRRIDILTSIEAVEFEEAWSGRLVAQIGDLPVPVLSRDHLIRNKKAVDRPQDRADVAWLEKHGG